MGLGSSDTRIQEIYSMKTNDMDSTSQDRSTDLDLSVVVPLYNEEESVGHLVAAICDAHEQAEVAAAGSDQTVAWELILVDDGSTDSTVQAANEACAGISLPTRVVTMNRNFGQTAAMQAGIDAAHGELIATLDGDLQNDPADIPRMVDHLRANDLDLLVGKRAKRKDGLILRLIPSWIANRLIAKVTGVKIRDYGCSLKIYRASIIRQISLLGEMHRFIPAWIAVGYSSESDWRDRCESFPTSVWSVQIRHLSDHSRYFGSGFGLVLFEIPCKAGAFLRNTGTRRGSRGCCDDGNCDVFQVGCR